MLDVHIADLADHLVECLRTVRERIQALDDE